MVVSWYFYASKLEFPMNNVPSEIATKIHNLRIIRLNWEILLFPVVNLFSKDLLSAVLTFTGHSIKHKVRVHFPVRLSFDLLRAAFRSKYI